MKKSPLQLRQLSAFKYAGMTYDFSYVVDRKTGSHIHELCGFGLISAITNKLKTSNSSKAVMQQLKQFWEDVVIYNNVDWRDLSDEEIIEYLYQYRFEDNNISGSSIDLQRSAIQSFYDWTYKYGFIKYPMELDIGFEIDGFKDSIENPDPHTAIESQYLNKVEFETLLAHVPGGNSNYLLQRNELVLMLGYHCGVRTHELTNTHNFKVKELIRKIESSNNSNDASKKNSFELTIYGKGNSKARNILIPPAIFKKLNLFLKDKKLRGKFSKNLPLFLDKKGKPIIGTGFGSYIFRISKASCRSFIGKRWKYKTYHSLRHTYATNLATWCSENGYDWRAHVPSRLGHSKWETSQIYVEVEALMNNRIDVLNKLKPITKLAYTKH